MEDMTVYVEPSSPTSLLPANISQRPIGDGSFSLINVNAASAVIVPMAVEFWSQIG